MGEERAGRGDVRCARADQGEAVDLVALEAGVVAVGAARAARVPLPELRFLPVRVVEGAARPGSSGVVLEIALPNGRVVRVPPGFDGAMLADVLSIASEVGLC